MNDNIIFLILIVSLGIIILLGGFFLMFHKSQLKIAEQNRRWQEEKLLHHQDLIRATVASQDLERKRIGRDLHDGIGTSLTILRLGIEHFELQNSPTNPSFESFFLNCKTKIDTVISSCRHISHNLSPEIFTLNTLSGSIEELANFLPLSEGVHLEADESLWQYIDALNEEQAINVYRILEELLNNTVRHAGANKVVIGFTLLNNRLHVNYYDNGIGIQLEKHKPGHGLQHIESRLLVLDGHYETISEPPNSGYNLQFSFPLNR